MRCGGKPAAIPDNMKKQKLPPRAPKLTRDATKTESPCKGKHDYTNPMGLV
jgi:hypothetical protein